MSAKDIAATSIRLLDHVVYVKMTKTKTTVSTGRQPVMSKVTAEYHIGCAYHGISDGAGIYFEYTAIREVDGETSSYSRTSASGPWEPQRVGGLAPASLIMDAWDSFAFERGARLGTEVACGTQRCWSVASEYLRVPDGQISGVLLVAKNTGLPVQWTFTARASDGSVSDVTQRLTDYGVPNDIRPPR
jgi:hypothetical protein